jgi:hypothetical protein
MDGDMPRSGTKPTPTWILILAPIAAAIVGAAMGWFLNTRFGANTSTSTLRPKASISYPPDNTRDLPLTIEVSGTYENLSPAQQIWLANRWDGDPRHYYVGRYPCSKLDPRHFECPSMQIGLPGDHGKPYIIFTVIAEGNITSKGLGVGATIGDAITVVRK